MVCVRSEYRDMDGDWMDGLMGWYQMTMDWDTRPTEVGTHPKRRTLLCNRQTIQCDRLDVPKTDRLAGCGVQGCWK